MKVFGISIANQVIIPNTVIITHSPLCGSFPVSFSIGMDDRVRGRVKVRVGLMLGLGLELVLGVGLG
jgi:Na+-driven multidrug efflux pump